MQSATLEGGVTRSRLRSLHSASGLFPLAAYLVFHAWEHWPVRVGRDALFARLLHTQSIVLELLFVLLPLLLHAALGLVLARDPEGVRSYVSPAFRKLQIGSGIVSALFLAFHLVTAWLPRVRSPHVVGASYAAMLAWSGTLPLLVLHAVGIAAVCTHLGQGLGLALPRWLPTRRATRDGHRASFGVSPSLGRWLGLSLGILLWLIYLNELATYATYAPLL